MKAKLSIPLVSILLLSFIWLGIANIRHSNNKLQMQKIELKSSEAKLKELNLQYENVLNSKAQTEQEKQQQLEKIKQLEQEKVHLQGQLQAKLNKQQTDSQRIAKAAQAATGVASVSAQSGCNTGNPYKDYIYMKESGCRPSAVNSIGCRGIGQACPGTKLPCGADFSCQDAYFSNYAISRYGSWENAYNFWINHHWW